MDQQTIDREMNKFWEFVNDALDKYHERERWVSNQVTYNDAGIAIPKSIMDFSTAFLEGLSKIKSV